MRGAPGPQMLRRLNLALLAAGALILLAVAVRQGAPESAAVAMQTPAAPTRTPISTVEARDQAAQMLALVNEARCAQGLIPLTWNPLLSQAALAHSRAMAEQDFFDHVNPVDGSGPGDRVSAAGYEWYTVGENIAAGSATVGGTFEQWWNSPPHQRTMLHPDFREMGLGYVFDAESASQHYWTQTFGMQREAYGEPPQVSCEGLTGL
jgi:uncharacterized protein YkwD